LLLLLFPGVANLTLSWRILVGVGAVVLPLAYAGLAHLARVLAVFCRRAQCYNALVTEIEELRSNLGCLQSLSARLLHETRDRNAFRIDHCYTYDRRTFIVLQNRPGAHLAVGTRVAVLDAETGVMGEFEVMEREPRGYHCELRGHIDAVWLGNIKRSADRQSEVPPEWRAMIVSARTGDDNE
jgi:hypothetical protein